MPTLRIKEEWGDQMKKKNIIYSWENSVRCLFEVKIDNVILWNRDNQHPGGIKMIISYLRKAFQCLTQAVGLDETISHSGFCRAGIHCPPPTWTDRAKYSTVHNRVLLIGGLGLTAKMSWLALFNSSQTPDTISLSFLFPSVIHFYHETLSNTGSHVLDMVQRYSILHSMAELHSQKFKWE